MFCKLLVTALDRENWSSSAE